MKQDGREGRRKGGRGKFIFRSKMSGRRIVKGKERTKICRLPAASFGVSTHGTQSAQRGCLISVLTK